MKEAVPVKVLMGQFRTTFFVNCYSVFASIKQVRIEVINSFNFLL